MVAETRVGTDVDVADLDVPCLIYSADVIRSQYARLHAFLESAYPNAGIFYAAKACYCPQVVQLLVKLGCGLELLSMDERHIASAVGVTGRAIVWNGCALSDAVLSAAVSQGEWLNVDSPSQYHRIERIAAARRVSVEVGLRLNVEGTGKLGMEYDDVVGLARSDTTTRIVGLHFHQSPKSQGNVDRLVTNRLKFLDMASRLEREEGISLQYVDIGGGLLPDVALDKQLGEVTKAMSVLQSKPMLFLEPGAYFVEEAGIALARVMATKRVGGMKWATVDIGLNVLVPLDRARFTVSNQHVSDGPAEPTCIAGAFGISSDVVALNQVIALQEGDILRIERCGAYTESMSSCMIAKPPSIYWHTCGRYERIVAGRIHDNLFMNYHGYDGSACRM